MREIKFISPSSLKMWETSREEFYVTYLSPTRQVREPQTPAMAVGSAFDAYVKSSLYKQLIGKGDPRFDFENIFVEQVEPHVRDFAISAGQHCFAKYCAIGAYQELFALLAKSEVEPRFEFKLIGEINGVPLVGKPDCWFQREGVGVVLDWKVTGFCSKTATSPKKGYISCRDTWEPTLDTPATRTRERKGLDLCTRAGMVVNNVPLENGDKGWADQVAIYAWMLGYNPGDESYIACIDQLTCKPCEPMPLIRVAQHRSRVSTFWQFSLVSRLQSCWARIKEGHIFTDVTLEESKAMCEVLDMQDYSSDNEFVASLRKKRTFG